MLFRFIRIPSPSRSPSTPQAKRRGDASVTKYCNISVDIQCTYNKFMLWRVDADSEKANFMPQRTHTGPKRGI